MIKRPAWHKKLTDIRSNCTAKLKQGLKKADQKVSLTVSSRRAFTSIKIASEEINQKTHLIAHCTSTFNKGAAGLKKINNSNQANALRNKSSAVSDKIKAVTSQVEIFNHVTSKTRHATANGLHGISAGYGIFCKARSHLYFEPESARELLKITKEELIYINACILQISPTESEQFAIKLGNAIAAKVGAGIGVGALLSLVSAFGTAGTGTAIAGLSGAAATNATLAWVGGLVGGGMATGTLLTGGLGLVLGASIYRLLSSEARHYETLDECEQQIIEANCFLISAINDLDKQDEIALSPSEAQTIHYNLLSQLHENLTKNKSTICSNLDYRNRTAFENRAILNFERRVLRAFENYTHAQHKHERTIYPEVAIASTLFELINAAPLDDTRETQLVIEALRRIRIDWSNASPTTIGFDLSGYNADQLRGIANNCKGVYHELLFVDDFNRSHIDQHARVHDAINQPGSDIAIYDRESNAIISEFQLKAGANNSLIKDHFEKYPDIPVLATEEIALSSGLCNSSGFSNDELNNNVNSTLDALEALSPCNRAADSAEAAILVGAGKKAVELLLGKKITRADAISTFTTAGIAASSTTVISFLFG